MNRCVEYFKNQLVELVGLSVLSAMLAVKFTDYVGHGSSRICKAEFLVTITECDGRKWYGEFYLLSRRFRVNAYFALYAPPSAAP